ncbi:argininosuccinate lyase [uncultured Victivallis sp.]|uniref:argininosuccinate lyase n=1 Tax=uncultured Victivallis sp. TaxID=354118 RepID=UPI0025DF6821|nr:argininosuccinate lyase [uncultured Victivallis sp.]
MALWGGRFSSDTRNEVTQYSESISFDRRLYHFDIMGSKAHVTMLAAQKIIPEATAEAICAELDKIEKRIDAGDFKYDIAMEDIHMHIESALIDALGAEGARVHSARSRNDQVALDIRLYLRDEVDKLIEGIRHFQRALVAQADANPRTIMPGFTHLQHAQVVLFAHHLLAYVEMLDRDAERLAECRRRINVMPLGSGAIAGSTLPIDREAVCRALNFSRVTRNSMDAVADRDFAIELVSDLAIFAMHTSRLSEDLILWCSQEFDFIELDDAFCTGSSLMPQKKNPDVCELTRGKTARVYGALTALLTMCKGLPLTYNRDLQEDKVAIFDALDTVKMILKVYPPMIETMKLKADHMRAAASDPALMATDIAEKLVELGVPFRSAHHRVGAFVKYCREHKKALNEVTLDEMRETIPEATPDFLNLFDPVGSVAKRNVTGGTGFDQVAGQLEFWKKSLAI